MAESAAAESTEVESGSNFRGAFLRGLTLGICVYALMGGWLWLSGDKTIAARQATAPSKTVTVEWPHAEAAAEEIGEALTFDPAAPGLPPAPVAGLFEETAQGKLPVRREGMTAFQAYRRPFDRATTGNRPIISIIVTGMGLSDQATENALHSMPPEVTFALSPYSLTPDMWMNESRARGHEVWMSLPLEPVSYPVRDTGPNTIVIGAPERENLLKLSWLMGRTTGYAGFIAGQETEFVNSAADMKPVISAIYSRGLGFAENAANAGAAAATMAMSMESPYATIDVWLDDTATQESIRAALEELEKKARTQGGASGVIRALPVSYQEVTRWITTLKDKGFVLAPLSAQTRM
jgi:polysaccharide deacetylase 2 family uncharacterized protein YibQ